MIDIGHSYAARLHPLSVQRSFCHPDDGSSRHGVVCRGGPSLGRLNIFSGSQARNGVSRNGCPSASPCGHCRSVEIRAMRQAGAVERFQRPFVIGTCVHERCGTKGYE